jgi:hypothetical protein
MSRHAVLCFVGRASRNLIFKPKSSLSAGVGLSSLSAVARRDIASIPHARGLIGKYSSKQCEIPQIGIAF